MHCVYVAVPNQPLGDVDITLIGRTRLEKAAIDGLFFCDPNQDI